MSHEAQDQVGQGKGFIYLLEFEPFVFMKVF